MSVSEAFDMNGDILLTIADLAGCIEWELYLRCNCVPTRSCEAYVCEFERGLWTDGDRIIRHVFFDDEEGRSTSEFDPTALTDRVEIRSSVFSDLVSIDVEDVSFLGLDLALEELFHIDLPDEAEAL